MSLLEESKKLLEAKEHPLLKDLDKAMKLIDKVRRGKTKIEDDVVMNDSAAGFRNKVKAIKDYANEILKYVDNISA